MSYQPKTGERCSCRRGIERDNCPTCEGTGWKIDFRKIREHQQTGGRIVSKYRFKVYGWRDGLNTKPMCFVENIHQAAREAIKIRAELLAFDQCMNGLGPCNVRVDPLGEQLDGPMPGVSDSADAALMAAQDEAQWKADILMARVNMQRDAEA